MPFGKNCWPTSRQTVKKSTSKSSLIRIQVDSISLGKWCVVQCIEDVGNVAAHSDTKLRAKWNESAVHTLRSVYVRVRIGRAF